MLGLHNAWAGFRDVGSLLIKRGTVMGPLILSLYLALALFVLAVVLVVLAAYPLRETAVEGVALLLSVVFVLSALGIIIGYYCCYTYFAKRDPDRLQSEEYRLLKMQQMIAAKDLRHPVPEGTPPLTEPTENPIEPQSRTEGKKITDSTVAEEEREP